jgi:hypothetical protein
MCLFAGALELGRSHRVILAAAGPSALFPVVGLAASGRSRVGAQ